MARILIVEDSPTQMEGLRRVVEGMGHTVVGAEDGDEAVRQARSAQPDVILMDVVMPGVNGFQATRTITRDPTTAHIPVVIITTKDGPADRAWGMRQGARAYITKPVTDGDIVAALNEALNG